jgi:hypothetical protein
MSAAFENFSAEEQHPFLMQILQRTGDLPDGLLEDGDLAVIADQLFQALDEGERHCV